MIFRGRVPPMLRDRAFRRYWSGQTISMFGDQITTIVVPLIAVLTLRSSPAQMGVLSALVWVPSLLFAMHAGAWADRRGRRRIMMIVADLGRAVLLASIPVCYALGVLTLWQLYAVAFCAGMCSVLFTVCDTVLFVALVPPSRYVEGKSLVYGSRALSVVGGPSVGGVLVQVLSAPFAIIADALSFLGSAFFLSRIQPSEPAPGSPGRGELTAGAKFIRESPIVRSSLLALTLINFFNFVFLALFVLYAIRALHIRAGLLGLIMGVGAVGGVLGALVTRRLVTRLGIGWVFTASCLVYTAPLVLVPLAAGTEPVIVAMLFAVEFISGFGVMALDISLSSIFAVVIPAQLRSRVSGAMQMVSFGTRPLGALTGGLLGTVIGTRPTLFIATVGGMTGFACLLPSPVPGFRMPDDPENDTERDAAINTDVSADSQ